MTDQEGRIEALAREAAAKYIAPFHKTDARLHEHRIGAVAVFEELRKRQERELATVIADAIRTALKSTEVYTRCAKELAENYRIQNENFRTQLAEAREALGQIWDHARLPETERSWGYINVTARDALAKGDKT